MVTLLYVLILLPVIAWLAAFGYETWLVLGRSGSGNYSLGAAHNDASWEITHTFLVYAFTVFLISYADALIVLDRVLFLPACIFMISLIARGCLYLYLSYGERIKHIIFWYNLFALSYVVTIVSVFSGLVGVVVNLRLYAFTPSTDNIGIVAIGFVLTSALCAVPILTAFRQHD